MKSIPVKMCCHSTKSSAKFFATIGDVVLIRPSAGLLQELTIEEVTESSLNCRDNGSEKVVIFESQIEAIYMD